MAVKILGWFLLKWAGFGELLGWKSSTRSGNTGCTLTNQHISLARTHTHGEKGEREREREIGDHRSQIVLHTHT